MLEEERRNTIERAWAHNFRAEEAREAVVLEGKLRVTEKTIESLKNTIDKSGQETKELRSKLSMNEAQLGSIDIQLRHAERGAYCV